jgi:hypothetical protein
MKPPETVTLINLDGSFVFPADTRHEDYMRGSLLMANNSEHGWYAIEFSVDFSRQLTLLPDNANILEERENVIFLNNQLTLIRKGFDVGHFNDLAIYQATLGRYWEVPWYKVDYFKTLDGRESITKCKNVHLPSGYVGTVYQPTYWQFLKHYPDVFSKLTPYKGE